MYVWLYNDHVAPKSRGESRWTFRPCGRAFRSADEAFVPCSVAEPPQRPSPIGTTTNAGPVTFALATVTAERISSIVAVDCVDPL